MKYIKKYIADYAGLILIATYIGVVMVLFVISMTATARADTLICERYDMNGDQTIIFSYTEVSNEMADENRKPTDIVRVNAASNGFSSVKFRDKRKLYLNAANVTCHEVEGNGNELEARRVFDFINTIKGVQY